METLQTIIHAVRSFKINISFIPIIHHLITCFPSFITIGINYEVTKLAPGGSRRSRDVASPAKQSWVKGSSQIQFKRGTLANFEEQLSDADKSIITKLEEGLFYCFIVMNIVAVVIYIF